MIWTVVNDSIEPRGGTDVPSRRLGWLLARLWLAGVTVSVGLHASPATSVPVTFAPDARRVSELLDEVAPEGALEPDAAGRQIAALGMAEFPLVFELLTGGSGRGTLTEPRRTALKITLEAWGAEALRPAIRARIDQGLDELECRSMIRVVGMIGEAEDISILAELATPTPDDLHHHHHMTTAFRYAVGAIFTRDQLQPEGLRHLVLRAHPEVCESLIEAIAARRSPAALELIVSLLRTKREVDRLAMKKTWLLAKRLGPVLDNWGLDRIRSYLQCPEEELLVDTIYSLGFLADAEALPELIDLLAEKREAVRSGARTALTQITGLRFGTQQARWKSWLDQERRWHREEAPELYHTLRDGAPGEILDGLLELGKHSLHRNRVAKQVGPLLWHQNSHVRVMACTVLGDLAARQSTRDLLDCLTEPDDRLVAEAHKALSKITGLDLPPEYMPWRLALDAQDGATR